MNQALLIHRQFRQLNPIIKLVLDNYILWGFWGLGSSPSDKNNIPHVAKVDSQRFSSSSQTTFQSKHTTFLQQAIGFIKFV